MKDERYPKELFSWQVRHNGLITRRFSRDRIRAFRGEDENSGKRGAMLGQGICSATRRADAERYGKVRIMKPEELPENPLRFRDFAWLEMWQSELRRTLGDKEYHRRGEFDGIARELGFDGMTVGCADDMWICTYGH